MTRPRLARTITAIASGDIQLREDSPAPPSEGQVAGRTIASVLSPGTELAWGYDTRPDAVFPRDLGYSAAFRVEETSPQCGIEPGDIVMSLGTHSSWQVADARDVVALPPSLDPLLAPFARILHVPLAALTASTIAPGQPVGVIGLGLVGQCAVRVLRACGFQVHAADADPQRRRSAECVANVSDTLRPDSVDLMLECSGHESNALMGARALRHRGELVLVGVPWRRRDDTAFFDFAELTFSRLLRIRSGWEWQVPFRKDGLAAVDGRDLIATALLWLTDGTINISGLYDVIAPAEIPAAYRRLKARQAPALTSLVDWSLLTTESE